MIFMMGSFSLIAQTFLSGKVTDTIGEPVLFANVAMYQDSFLAVGRQTDFDGNFSFSHLDAGMYAVEITYGGLATARFEEVKIEANKSHLLNVTLTPSEKEQEKIIMTYEVPPRQHSSCTLTAEEIKNLPTRNIEALAATAAGLSSKKKKKKRRKWWKRKKE